MDTSWGDELCGRLSLQCAALVEAAAAEEEEEDRQRAFCEGAGIADLSDEVLLLIVRLLDPTSLLRVGAACRALFRVCSSDSLWTKHFQVSFGVSLDPVACSLTAKESFRLVFMWKTLFNNLHYNRSLQEKLFAEIPFPPHRYWTQWLVLEEIVSLPAVRLPISEIQEMWGVDEDVLTKAEGKDDDGDIVKFEWKELYALARDHHGSDGKIFEYVLNQQEKNDHTELEAMFYQYTQCRFQWLFTYWLFRRPPPFNRQLRAIFLQWHKHSKRKVAAWGTAACNVKYLASIHAITMDYWNGKLARGDESVGISVVENYFSMCKSLVAWVLGRDWGRLKRRKVYKDTLDGVYLLLRREIWDGAVEHQRFWEVAKLQVARVCTLEETATNYVNWKMIENLPYYKLYMVSGNPVYLVHVQNFLRRKQLVHNWIHQEDNSWIRNLLPDDLYTVMEYHSKISHDSLHGDCVLAQLSRLMWLYLNSGQVLYLEAIKGLALQYAQGCLVYWAEHQSRLQPRGGLAQQRCPLGCLKEHTNPPMDEHPCFQTSAAILTRNDQHDDAQKPL